jgi:hypothetical protein
LTVLALQGASAEASSGAALVDAAESSALHVVAVLGLLCVRLAYWASKQFQVALSSAA